MENKFNELCSQLETTYTPTLQKKKKLESIRDVCTTVGRHQLLAQMNCAFEISSSCVSVLINVMLTTICNIHFCFTKL